MIDIHSHIIYGVDDGARTKEMTLEMLKLSEESGVKKIVATPHYMKGRFQIEYNEIKEIVNEIRQMAKEENLNIEIYYGQEVYYTENIFKYYMEGEIGTINNSRYMLIELPMREFDVNKVIDGLYELTLRGIKPIVAHPERYIPFIKDPSLINAFIKEGYLFQLNADSVIGEFGKSVKKLALLYLENGVYDVIGSDAHSIKNRNTDMRKPIEEVLYKYRNDFYKNGQNILENEIVEKEEKLIKARRKFFDIFKF